MPTKLLNLLMASCLVMSARTTFAGEDTTYKEQALRLIAASKDIFVKRGMCASPADCVKKEFVLGTGSPSGIVIELYELDSETIGEVIGLCLAEYERNRRKISVTVSAYKEPHSARVNQLFALRTPKPVVELMVRPEQ